MATSRIERNSRPAGSNGEVQFNDGGVFGVDSHFTYDKTNDVLHTHKLAGDATDGLIIESANGTDIGILGAANTANVTWYGSHNFDTATANTVAFFGASKTLSSDSDLTYDGNNLGLNGYIDFTEISTPSTPSANHGRLYGKDFDGNTLPYWVDESGTEYDLTGGGGGGGVTTLPGLTDVDDATVNTTSGHVLRATGTAWVNAQLAHSDLSGVGTNAHSVIDAHIDSDTTVHANATNLLKTTGNQTKSSGTLTFTVLPQSSAVPSNDADLVNKSYVDTFSQGLTPKAACRVATTTAGTLASDFENGDTVDGVVLATNDRILIKDQADATTNGIYTVNASGAPTRATDYDVTSEVQEGTFTFVSAGTANANKQFVQTTVDPVLGVDNLVFSQLSAPTAYTASNGVLLSGTDIQIDLSDTNPSLEVSDGGLRAKVDDSSIERAAGGLQVKDGGITNSKIADVAASKITGQVALTQGGTGLSTAGTANYLLGMNSGATALEYKQLVAGSNVTINHTAGSVSISASAAGGGGTGEIIVDVDLISDSNVNVVWTNMPAATTELFGNTAGRFKYDLSAATEYRIVVQQNVAGANNADLNLQYSTDNVTYAAADTAAAGELAVGAGTGVKVGAWATLVSGAKADNWFRIVGKDGNGTADPAFRRIAVQFKIQAGSPADATYVVMSASPGLSDERVLTGTANQITVTDGGAGGNVTLSIPSAAYIATSLDLGDTSDTTITRSSAGIIAVEGVAVPTISSTDTLSNKTLSNPSIISNGVIRDVNGNEILAFNQVGSAVNHVLMINNVTTGAPQIRSTGDDTNINLVLYGKGTGKIRIVDAATTTKAMTFELVGATASTTTSLTFVQTANRTVTFPDATDTLVGKATTDTLTNKRITLRTGTTTSSATPTINTDNVDFYSITALTTAITSMTTNLSGTPTEGQKLWIAITGTAARAITWGSSFENGAATLPTTTVTTLRLDTFFIWNTVTSKWRCMATGSG